MGIIEESLKAETRVISPGGGRENTTKIYLRERKLDRVNEHSPHRGYRYLWARTKNVRILRRKRHKMYPHIISTGEKVISTTGGGPVKSPSYGGEKYMIWKNRVSRGCKRTQLVIFCTGIITAAGWAHPITTADEQPTNWWGLRRDNFGGESTSREKKYGRAGESSHQKCPAHCTSNP